MSKRRLDIDSDSDRLRISFEYDAALVDTVKKMPLRTWDPRQRAWFVPIRFLGRVWDVLEGLQFNVSDAVRALGEEHGVEFPAPVTGLDEPDAFAVVLDDSIPRVPLSDLNQRVRDSLLASFPEPIWVVGELSDWNPGRGRTIYFELIEQDPYHSGTVAKTSAVVFPRARARLEATLAQVGGVVALADGIQVCFKARVELYAATGRYQLIIEDIDPSYTLGRLTQKRDMILRRLESMGITAQNLAVAVPAVPLRVGLITSVGSHAYGDVIGELAGSGFGFEVLAYDAQMQGRYLETTVLAALAHFAQHPVDVIMIARGGGARTDLGWFDTLKLAIAVCQHPLPVLIGIGHNDDRCVLDELGRSYRTPTAAARFLVETVRLFMAELDELQEHFSMVTGPLLEHERVLLQTTAHDLAREVRYALSGGQRELTHQAARLGQVAGLNLREAERRMHGLQERLPDAAKRRLRREHQQLDFATDHRLSAKRLSQLTKRQRHDLDTVAERLERATGRRMRRNSELLDQLEARCRGLDPKRVLRRGFTIVHNAAGTTVSRAHGLQPDDPLHITFADGVVTAEVTAGQEDP